MTENERINNILKENGLSAKKSFGQNFLINEGIINRIVNSLNVDKYQTTIEIGPGLASLTLPLSKKANKLIAVDADRDMVAILKDLFKNDSKTTIIESDFLRFDPDLYSDKNNRVFVGNLPYNITSELLEYMLEKDFTIAGVMVQKEVAEKLIYIPKKKENTPLGAFIKARGNLKLVTNVDSSCFNPAPKVESAFIKIEKQNDCDFKYYSVFKALFKDPNKNISNCLKQSKQYSKALDILRESLNEYLPLRARQLEVTDLLKISTLILNCCFS